MPQIVYVQPDGSREAVPASPGATVMMTAVGHGIPGIVAECGGSAMCATCHVYVDEAWVAKTGTKSAMEESMLDFAEGVQDNSRLSCQIKVSDDLDGLKVTMPESQH